MKFAITRTNVWNYNSHEIKEFKSIAELLRFKKKVNNELIITDHSGRCYAKRKCPKSIKYEIEIYDNYRE